MLAARRVVERVDGRTEDFVVLRVGRPSGPSKHLFKYMGNVREAQIQQKGPGEIAIQVVVRAGLSVQDEQRLLEEISLGRGEGNRVGIRYVDATERDKSGKLRAVVSEAGRRFVSAGHGSPVAGRSLKAHARLPVVLQNAVCSVGAGA